MKKLISAQLAGNILLILFILLALFHGLVIFKLVPSELVWGGQVADSSSNRILFEIIALLVILIFIMIVAAKIGYVQFIQFKKIINAGIWFIFAYMLLNTLGNLASGVAAEKMIFTPISLIMAILALRLGIEKDVG